MVIGLVSPAYGAALPETSVPETTQEAVSSGDTVGADSEDALPEEAEEVTEAPAEDAEAVEVYEAAETDGIVYATILFGYPMQTAVKLRFVSTHNFHCIVL